jgi:hypothetical protein
MHGAVATGTIWIVTKIVTASEIAENTSPMQDTTVANHTPRTFSLDLAPNHTTAPLSRGYATGLLQLPDRIFAQPVEPLEPLPAEASREGCVMILGIRSKASCSRQG